MKSLQLFLLSLVLAALSLRASAADDAAGKIRILVVTGGHDFEQEPFFKLFKENPEVSFKAVEHPNTHAFLKPDAAKNWDVLVLHHMHQEISDEPKADFLARLHEGKGLVVVHHAIADYQD